MDKFKYLFAIFTLVISNIGVAENSLKNIPDFKLYAAEGTLKQTIYSEDSVTKATLVYREGYPIQGKSDCRALTLKSPSESILAVVLCNNDGNYLICHGAKEPCSPFTDSKRSKNKISMKVSRGFGDDDTKFEIEFYKDKLVYRIQDESCLIPYPHGCLVDGFSWDDAHVYTFTKNK